MKLLVMLAAGVAAGVISAYGGTAAARVYLAEPGIWDRMSAGHGRSYTVGGTNVFTCAPSALYLATDGHARAFHATGDVVSKACPARGVFRVFAENRLVFESAEVSKTSGPVRIDADLAGARWVKLEVYGTHQPYALDVAWQNAYFEMAPGRRPHDIGDLSRQLGVLTPPEGASPRINSPARFGVRPGSPLFYRVPVVGRRPMATSVTGLPPGAGYDAAAQLITGRVVRAGTYRLTLAARNAAGAAQKAFDLVVGEKIALTPPIGWNSWNAFADKVTAREVRRTAELLQQLGLLEHGWAYLTIDDGWQLPVKDFPPDARRTADGTVKSNALFGDMKALADYVHARGLKIGLYSSPGPVTCANFEGSWRHEFQDARTYAEWGYDYLKHDWCSYSSVAFGEGTERWLFPYLIMSHALRASGRDIVHSICQYGFDNVASWGESAGGNCWRTTGDKFDFWEDVVTCMETQARLWRYPRPGAWNDADMMLIGKTVWSDHKGTRLTPNEQYTHVSLLAMWASVMMIGCDLEGADDFTLSLVRNDEVIAINQDVLGKAAALIDREGDFRFWARPLADGAIAVAIVNLSPYEQEGCFDLARNGLTGTWRVRDVWRNDDVGTVTRAYAASVPGHATVLLKLTPQAGAGLRPGMADIREMSFVNEIRRHRPLEVPSVPAASPGPSARCATCPF